MLRSKLVQHATSPKKVLAAFVANYVICSLLFSLVEKKGPITGLWWGIVTVSTTGYGDYSPVSTTGRGIAAWLMVFSAVLLLLAYGHAANYFLPDPNTFTDAEQKHVLRKIDETNYLIREQFRRTFGRAALEDALDRFDAEYDPTTHEKQKEKA